VATADRADSAAERLIVKLLRGAGITGWERGVPFGPWTIDLAFPDAKVAVEVDGWAWHVDVDRFPRRPPQGQRARPPRVDGAQVHLARRGQQACLRGAEIRAALA
jgi:hypothetical protein